MDLDSIARCPDSLSGGGDTAFGKAGSNVRATGTPRRLSNVLLVFAGDPCTHRLLRHAPGQLFVYDPADGVGAPRFRFLPDASLPDGLVTNQIGWRGAPIQNPRGDKSVRIVFVGSSTVVDAHYVP